MTAQGLSNSSLIQTERPAAIAKDMLSDLLGRVQDIRNAALDVDQVSRNIALSVRALFSVQSTDLADPSHFDGIDRVMAHMRETLALLQDLRSDELAIADASRVIAKVLAILYPMVKAHERMVAQPRQAPSVVGKPVKRDPRRASQRIQIEADIGLQSDTNFFTGFTEDISEGGIFVATYDIKPLGSTITVSFTLPDGYVVVAQGEVSWIREYNDANPDMHPGMGIRFRDIVPKDQQAIKKFLKQRPPIFFE